jgi:hypothetical protein
VVIVRSRSRATFNQWLFDDYRSVCDHALTCLRVQQVRMSICAVAALPSVRERFRLQSTTLVRLHIENTLEKHGITVPRSTMSAVVNRLRGADRSLAQESLQATNKLLHAFVLKNPGSRIVLEKSAGLWFLYLIGY